MPYDAIDRGQSQRTITLGGAVTYGGFPLIIDYHSYRDDVDDGQRVRVLLFHSLVVNLSCSCLLCSPTLGPKADTNGTKCDDTNDDGDDAVRGIFNTPYF